MEVGALRTAQAGAVVDGDGASQLLTVPAASEDPRDKREGVSEEVMQRIK